LGYPTLYQWRLFVITNTGPRLLALHDALQTPVLGDDGADQGIQADSVTAVMAPRARTAGPEAMKSFAARRRRAAEVADQLAELLTASDPRE
jgi:hypothetical protein